MAPREHSGGEEDLHGSLADLEPDTADGDLPPTRGDETVDADAARLPDESQQLRLLVFGDETYAAAPLPSLGAVTIGRSPEANVRVADASLSRMHAVLRVSRDVAGILELTVEDLGHVRIVKPVVVLEVAFDSIQHSGRHLSGYALRFPRIVRIRDDKPVDEVDTVQHVAKLYDRYFGETSEVALSEVAET